VRDVLTAVEIERALRVAEGTEETDKAAREERCRRRARTAWDSRIPSSCHGRRDRPTAFAPVGKSDGTDVDYEAALPSRSSPSDALEPRLGPDAALEAPPVDAAGRDQLVTRSGAPCRAVRPRPPVDEDPLGAGGAQMVRPNAPVLDELAQRLGVHRRASWERAPAASLNWLTPDVQTRSHSGGQAKRRPGGLPGRQLRDAKRYLGWRFTESVDPATSVVVYV